MTPSPPAAPGLRAGARALLACASTLALASGLATAAVLAQSRPAARAVPAADDLAKWRAGQEAKLRAPEGYLSIAGLFFLAPGVNTLGSAPASHIVLPADVAPPRLGTVTVREGTVRFEITAGVEATLNGQAASEGELRLASADPERPADVLRIGRLALQLHRSGPRVALRLRDPDHPVRTTFTGMRWYAADPAWTLTADFVAYPSPRRVTILNVLGDELDVSSPGVARFKVGEQALSLTAFDEGGKLWFVFTDATAGQGTYKAARFLYADPPRNGKVTLDFNRAENPPCAYNPFTTCPLPPRENRLPLPVTAGERDYPNRWQPR